VQDKRIARLLRHIKPEQVLEQINSAGKLCCVRKLWESLIFKSGSKRFRGNN
jgi:hypothetical protein